MALEPTADTWNEPCDLCGNVRYEERALHSGARSLRCRVCGLVTIVTSQRNGTSAATDSQRLSQWATAQLLLHARKEHARSILIIVSDDLPSEDDLRKIGDRITGVREDESGTTRPSNALLTEVTSLANAPFMADQFDLIICLRPIESFSSPALVFEKTRMWLAAGGTLLIAGLNRGSLPARLWKQAWMRAHADGAQRLLDSSNIRRYADRYGYEVRQLRTHSQSGEVAQMPNGDGSTSGMRMAIGGPMAMAANLFNAGDVFIASLMKAGVAMHPLSRRVDAQEERSPGLAPAMYSSKQF